MRISLSNSDRSFTAAPDQTVLDAALHAGLNLPHSCKTGHCGACRARLLKGEVRSRDGNLDGHPDTRPLGLSEGEIAAGWVLLCHVRAVADLRIETFEIRRADLASIKRLPARIERLQPLSHDVVSVHLRLPAVEAFVFEPGQYVDIMLADGRRRSFSIASPPHEARLLELHVRRVVGGEFTDALFTRPSVGSLLNIEGPLGQFVYRPPVTVAAPMVLIGGGTGVAPLLSMIRHAVARDIGRSMTVYWGVRAQRDLYAHAELDELSRRIPYLRYVPVLSTPSSQWRGRTGWVHDAVLEDLSDLASRDIYAAGPPAMIAAIRAEFPRRGVAASRLFFDSFDYAPDAFERQRTSSSSKS